VTGAALLGLDRLGAGPSAEGNLRASYDPGRTELLATPGVLTGAITRRR